MYAFIKNKVTVQSVLRYAFLVCCVGAVLWYAFHQSQNLLRGPGITLINEPSTVQHDRTVTIEGTAENITFLTLNGKQIHTDDTGYFAHTLVLENGYTIMTLYAEDRYGREVLLSKEFVYVPSA